MPPKSKKGDGDGEGESKPPQKKGGRVICNNRSPGPRYKLATLVGYKDHDTTKYRMPAYSFRRRQIGFDSCNSPGPKYKIDPDRFGVHTSPAYTFGYPVAKFNSNCVPGPKYLFASLGPRPPAYTIKSRTENRRGGESPGPYALPRVIPGPAFSLAARQGTMACDGSPGPKHGRVDLNIVKPKAPMYSLAYRQTANIDCAVPGPKYKVGLFIYKTPPIYSFGVRHSECSPPYLTPCDDNC